MMRCMLDSRQSLAGHRANAFRANVAELADALDLGSSGATRGSSSLPVRTKLADWLPWPLVERRLEQNPRTLGTPAGPERIPAQMHRVGSHAALRSRPYESDVRCSVLSCWN